MLDRFFIRPDVLSRLRAKVPNKLLKAFVTHLHDRGYIRSTIRTSLWALEHFNSWMQSKQLPLGVANKTLVRTFLREHLRKCQCPSPAPTRLQNVRPALKHFLRLLRDRGDLKSIVPPTPMEAVLEKYRHYLRDMGGLAESTCTSRVRYAREFLKARFGRGILRWQALRPRDGVSFIEQYARRCRPGTAQAAASSLRSFLRYLQFQGWCGLSLSAAVPRIPHWRLSSPPKTMNDEQLRKFLSTFNRSTARGRRGYAMALCQIVLGLRVSEVSRLSLEDIDWHTATIRIRNCKVNRERILPLPARVGRAIAQYLRRNRPSTTCRNVFVRHQRLRGTSVSKSVIREEMRLAYAKVPGCAHWTGTHALRHTAATHMLWQGASLKEIGDVLGHCSLSTTSIYAKVDLPSLTRVPLPWPEVQP